MIRIFGADHVRQQPRPRSSLLDGTWRQDGLHHALLAAPTGVLRPHILPDYKRRRYVVQLLRDVRTDANLLGIAVHAMPLTGRRYYPIPRDLVATVNAWRQMSAITVMRGSKRFTSKPGREPSRLLNERRKPWPSGESNTSR